MRRRSPGRASGRSSAGRGPVFEFRICRDHAIEHQPVDVATHAALAVGDAAAYSKSCAALAALAADGKDDALTLAAARVCVLAPDAGPDLAPLLAAEKDGDKRTRAGLLLRAGKAAEAVPLLEESRDDSARPICILPPIPEIMGARWPSRGRRRIPACSARRMHSVSYIRRTAGRHRHGLLKGGSRPPEYAVWAMAIQKCHNPNCREFSKYGGKGIRVCDRWLAADGFTSFLADVGRQPHPGAGLKRLDEQGHFEPGNVEWSDTRPCRVLTLNDRTMALADWARELGAKPGTLRARLHAGWPLEKVLARRIAYRKPSWIWRRKAKPAPDEASDEKCNTH